MIRLARVDEAGALTALCRRSKAHWGYDAAFMRLAAPALEVDAEAIGEGRVFVGVDGDDRALGVARLDILDIKPPDVAELGLLFVDPPAMGLGVGAALFRHVAAEARRRGCRRMTILADPFAAPFYERMGANCLGQAPSDAIPGRTLPLYDVDLTRPVAHEDHADAAAGAVASAPSGHLGLGQTTI
ncbi:GNAT family N-acetyltransferase [Sorangium cellulosum]|uniref:GNAT family N-acetyltransferase n=1 Tax=Sorangium cellulosum TaxID=56 RepID=UPI0018F86A2D|nr:GNAT family N-acetyltransferase [Sorangium cellulosum]